MKNLHQSELSVQRGRVHRPGAFVEPNDPLQSQTVVSLVLKLRIITVSNRDLCNRKELFCGNLSQHVPKSESRLAEEKLPQVHYQQPRFGHFFNGITQALSP